MVCWVAECTGTAAAWAVSSLLFCKEEVGTCSVPSRRHQDVVAISFTPANNFHGYEARARDGVEDGGESKLCMVSVHS